MMSVDWTKPIEAVHEDGRVEAVLLSGNHLQPDYDGDYTLVPGSLDGHDVYFSDGSSWGSGPWRIRNVAEPAKHVRTAADMLEWMEALVRGIAGDSSSSVVIAHQDEARAIVAEMTPPVDPDLVAVTEAIRNMPWGVKEPPNTHDDAFEIAEIAIAALRSRANP